MAGQMKLNPDWREFIELLNADSVQYLVVGGYAVAFHGHPRYTKDLDIWIWINPENAERMMRARTVWLWLTRLERARFFDAGPNCPIGLSAESN